MLEAFFGFPSIFGTLGSAFVLASFLIKNNVKLMRLINIVGAALFVVYGILLGTNGSPTWFMNGALIIVHIYYLFTYFKNDKKREDK